MAAACSRCAPIRKPKRSVPRFCAWKSRCHDMTQEKILYEVKENIARITLNRPEKRNALDAELIDELKEALASSARDEQCRVVVLSGAGTDFCSGADLAGLEKTSQAGVLEVRSEARHVADLFLMMRKHPRPIIAAVHGRALA